MSLCVTRLPESVGKPRSGEMFIEHEPELESVKLRSGAQPIIFRP